MKPLHLKLTLTALAVAVDLWGVFISYHDMTLRPELPLLAATVLVALVWAWR